MRRLLIRLLEWLTGEHVGQLKESLRVTEKHALERENALLRLHHLLMPGEPWYSWQRVYQRLDRLLCSLRPGEGECSGVSARWCPIHGDCTCADPDDLNDDDCPLHSSASKHGD